MNRQLNFTTTK